MGSLLALDLTYALDARIGEFNRLDLLFCKLDALLSSGGAANFKGLFYTSVGEKAERANTKENIVHNLTGDAVDLHADSDVDDACVPQGTNSLSDVSDVESLSEPIPTTPGGKPQVRFRCLEPQSRVWTPLHEAVLSLGMLHIVPLRA